jgi:uncharacterized protein (TIGR03435 family)
MKTAVSIACLGLTVASVSIAAVQNQPAASPGPAFEVASVKLSNPNANANPILGMLPIIRPAGDRLTATNVPLRMLVRMAYGIQEDFRIDGGPSWQMSQRFDITAKAEDGYTGGTEGMLPMLKTLLADRFKLKVHMETRDLPIQVLVIAREDGKLGGNLKPSTSDCSTAAADQQKLVDALLKGGPAAAAALLPKPGETRRCAMAPVLPASGSIADGIGMRADGQPLAILTALLTQVTGKIVRDKTGLTGLYDWEMKFDPQVLIQLASSQTGATLPAGVNLPESNAPSLLTALREELGLKLDSARGPVEVLVIDSAEMPTPD